MSDEIRADYEQLQQISDRFNKQAQEIQRMMQQVRGSMEKLKEGWIGRGSQAFFQEMQDKVIPGTARLYQALEEACRITNQIAQTVRQAEEDAASPFRV